MNQTVAFLGAGNMGTAIVSALLESGTVAPQNIKVADRHFEKLKPFANLGVQVAQHSEEILENTKFIVLAVKPQNSKELLESLQGSFVEGAVLISIAAGISVERLQEWSGLRKVVRIMPNTPAFVRLGVSGMYVGNEVSSEEKEFVQKLLESFSLVIPCQDEAQIDAITALSGSGPAYYFRIMEIMMEAAKDFGFSEDESRKITLQTLRGAGELAEKSGDSFAVLREKVTSKGGTTEAALKKLEEMKLNEVLNAGMEAALKRSKELQG